MGRQYNQLARPSDPELSRQRALDEDHKIKHAVQGVEFRF